MNIKKLLAVGIILLFTGTVFIPGITGSEPTSNQTVYSDENGTLSGYVKDTSMNPIEGAKLQVYFHESYEENYTDSSGYYHVTNIPICYCLKNATVSKEGYTTEWVLLAIGENTTYDFVLTPLGTIYVDDDNTEGPWDGSQEHPFQHIQDGINAAINGSSVYVYSGFYQERILINKSILLQGEFRENTVVDGDGFGKVFEIVVDGISLSDFTIQNGDEAINLHRSSNNMIARNNITNKTLLLETM